MIERTFGQLLRKAMNASPLTQAKLAELVGSTQSYMSQLARDDKKPSAPLVKQLAIALGADVNEFLLAAGFAPEGAMPLTVVKAEWWKGIPKDAIQPTEDEIALSNALGQWAPPNMDPRTDMSFWHRDRAARKRLFRAWEAVRDEYWDDGEEKGVFIR
jgi:transcriptional regulator with XRE-family HTH domain